MRLPRPIGHITSYKGLHAGTKYKEIRLIPEISSLRSIAYFRNFPFCSALLRDFLLVHPLRMFELMAVKVKGHLKNDSQSLFKIFLLKMQLIPLLILAAISSLLVKGWTIPEGRPNGFYAVTTDESGNEIHVPIVISLNANLAYIISATLSLLSLQQNFARGKWGSYRRLWCLSHRRNRHKQRI
jgi:hypothetical protein